MAREKETAGRIARRPYADHRPMGCRPDDHLNKNGIPYPVLRCPESFAGSRTIRGPRHRHSPPATHCTALKHFRVRPGKQTGDERWWPRRARHTNSSSVKSEFHQNKQNKNKT